MNAASLRRAVAARVADVNVNEFRQIGATASLVEGLYFDDSGFIDPHLKFALEVTRVTAQDRRRNGHETDVAMALQVAYVIRANPVDQITDRDAALDLAERIRRKLEEPVHGVDVQVDTIDMIGQAPNGGPFVVELSLTAFSHED